MKLSIITINTKKKELTIQCMESLYDVYRAEFENGIMELIIVDNNSDDDSVASMKAVIKKGNFKNFNIIESNKKLGFGSNNNLGVKQAKGEYILLLNNDTIVKSGIVEMLEYMEKHPEAAILGGSLKNFDATPQPSAGKFYTPVNAIMLMLGMQRFDLLDTSPKTISQVDWVKGALLMIRKDVFDKLGGFDEKIFMYTEDMELCYRAHLVGYKIFFYPEVDVRHKDQGSSNRTFAIVNIYKNLQYFYKKHRPIWEYWLIKFVLRTKASALVVIGKLLRNTYLTSTYEEALATT